MQDVLSLQSRVAGTIAEAIRLQMTPGEQAVNQSLNLASQKAKSADAARLHSLQEELIERERQENADRQATMTIAWRRQMGLPCG